MVAVLIIVGVLIIAVVIVAKSDSAEVKEAREKMKEAISENRNFTISKLVKDSFNYFYFAVDESRQEIFCYSRGEKSRFKYSDILAAEIQVDGITTVSKKSASLGGAIAGGLIAGGVGAIVGGSSMGKSISYDTATTINVHILLRNNEVDSFDIQCLNIGREVNTNEIVYITSNANAQKIYDALRIAMDKVKDENPQPQIVVQQKTNLEELKELADLKKQGLITDEEFATMKAKIINK